MLIYKYFNFSDTLYFIVEGCLSLTKPVILQKSDSLTTDPADFYFWSTGETTQSIIPKASGNYWVVIYDSIGCFATSDTFNLIITGLNNYESNKIIIYPNPNTGKFVIESSISSPALIRISNILGEIVYAKYVNDLNKNEINLDEPSGIYFLRLEQNNKVYFCKIIKG